MTSERAASASSTVSASGTSGQLPARVSSALTRYRVLAITTGIWLLVLTVEMIMKYPMNMDLPEWARIIPIVHGWVYFVYLIMATDLAVKARWRPFPTIGVLLAGTVPFLSFYVEHRVTQKVRAGQRL
ncbi:DUF3817 domain-containing protein [Hoyosella subflava]|uniref:Pks14 protein n=1 Tax=Hoyosella subflava (strain DSM 45089 / JCM 17490 / NBRC 109087 / DQS3-9A1) TaxID=443218 RepID=F6ES56_HOYSD|nr:DUF3817 domain-containing protein [Hoyosella subflava]AEF42060.1 Pks14 protein [Hoyosella subflava DQS3-9A1]